VRLTPYNAPADPAMPGFVAQSISDFPKFA